MNLSLPLSKDLLDIDSFYLQLQGADQPGK